MWKKRLGALALSAALALSLAVPALAAEDTAPAETAPLTREESARLQRDLEGLCDKYGITLKI